MSEVQPGDWAWRVNPDLDPREVTRIEPFVFDPVPGNPEGSGVWIHLLTGSAGPFPAENYTYTRRDA